MRDETRDWLDDALTQAPQWEPPSGFALHVTAAARQRHATPEPRLRRQRLFLASWWRSSLPEGLKARTQNTLWVLRQYVSLMRG